MLLLDFAIARETRKSGKKNPKQKTTKKDGNRFNNNIYLSVNNYIFVCSSIIFFIIAYAKFYMTLNEYEGNFAIKYYIIIYSHSTLNLGGKGVGVVVWGRGGGAGEEVLGLYHHHIQKNNIGGTTD